MYRPKTNRAARAIATAVAAIGLGTWLAGCSDIYLDRRETVGLSGGDAVAANEVTQMVDPWPRYSENRNIPANGQKMQSAVERYRTNRVIPPIGATTSVVDAPPAGAGAEMPPPSPQGASAPPPAGATATASVSSQ